MIKYQRRWEDLDPNILKQIFSLVPYEELFLNVSSVCQSWQAACFEFSFWSRNILDLTAATAGYDDFCPENLYSTNPTRSGFLKDGFYSFISKFDSPDKYMQMSRNLSRLLWRMMTGNDAYGRSLEDWRLSVRALIIPYDLPISDMHLVYIAKRLPGLECLSLLGATRITAHGFEMAVKNWKLLKAVHFGPVSFSDNVVSFPIYDHFIKGIGRNCQELEVLHIYQCGFILNRHKCLLIAQNLAGLKKLLVESPYVFKDGIMTMFQMCHQLEEVDVIRGRFLLDEFDCVEGWIKQKTTNLVHSGVCFIRANDGGWVMKCCAIFDRITPGLLKISKLFDVTPVVEFLGKDWWRKREEELCFDRKIDALFI